MEPKQEDLSTPSQPDAQKRYASELSEKERGFLKHVEQNLERNLQIFNWWCGKERSGVWSEEPDLRKNDAGGEQRLFFEPMSLDGDTIQLMGTTQDFLCMETLDASAEDPSRGVRELALGSFMQLTHPEAHRDDPSYPGLVYRPFYFRRRNGELGKISPQDPKVATDLTTLRETYEWVLFEVEILGSQVFRPFGPDGRVKMTLPCRQWITVAPELVLDREPLEQPQKTPAYGFGYFLVRHPDHPGLLAHGPGSMDTGFQLFRFYRSESGAIHARSSWITTTLERVFRWNIGPDPALSLLRAINFLTRNWAGRRMGLSKERFEERILLFHGQKHRAILKAAHQAWLSSEPSS